MNINVNFTDATSMIQFLNAVGIENVNLSLGNTAQAVQKPELTEPIAKPVPKNRRIMSMSKQQIAHEIIKLNPKYKYNPHYDRSMLIEDLNQERKKSPDYYIDNGGRVRPKKIYRTDGTVRECAKKN